MNYVPSPVTLSARVRTSSEWLRAGRVALALILLVTAAPTGAQEQADAQTPVATGEPVAVQAPAAGQEPIAAVWKREKIVFAYRSSLSVYSCDALKNRVASILYAVGARPDLEIKISNCNRSVIAADATINNPVRRTAQPATRPSYSRPTDFQQVSTVHVLLSMPAEMTPDVMTELKADKSRRELISRVTGDPVPRFDDPIPFAAERRVVTISHKTVGIEAAECELLDQIVTSSFENLGLRVVHQGYSCDPRRVSNVLPTLDVEALVPITFERGKTRQSPQEPEAEAEQDAPATPADAPPESSTDEPQE